MDKDTIWMRPPFGMGEPKEVEAAPAEISRLMVAGWSQCAPPSQNEEVKINEHD